MTPANLLLIGTTKEKSTLRKESVILKKGKVDRTKREEWGLPIV
jgi:hypothetical protein